MQIIDKKFYAKPWRFVFQCGLSSFCLLFVLIFLDAIEYPAIIASLGATAFIVFTRPKWYSSDLRRLLGGYFVGIAVGCICFYLSLLPLVPADLTSFKLTMIFWGALGVGIAIFVMSITDTEHPPAAGITLGLVIGQWNAFTIIFIVSALLFMFLLKKLFYKWLIDLI